MWRPGDSHVALTGLCKSLSCIDVSNIPQRPGQLAVAFQNHDFCAPLTPLPVRVTSVSVDNAVDGASSKVVTWA